MNLINARKTWRSGLIERCSKWATGSNLGANMKYEERKMDSPGARAGGAGQDAGVGEELEGAQGHALHCPFVGSSPVRMGDLF